MSEIRAVISDFGGVLTTPLSQSFSAMQEESGIPVEALGSAMAKIAEDDGAHPLYELETGRLTETQFLDRLARELSAALHREVHLHGFAEAYFGQLDPNDELLEYMRSLRARGFRMAILTNNVREWEPLWRAMLPVDEIFDLVVDSGFVGMRKPDREIYELTLERLGLPAQECLFVDDTDVNVEAARELGMSAVHFLSNAQAIPEMEAALDGARPADND
jgi:putative hydrolase of the HAD superfamily